MTNNGADSYKRPFPASCRRSATTSAYGGRLRIIASLTDPGSIRRYINGIELPAPPPF